MKFTVNCEDFTRQLQACLRVIGTTTISPILANIHLQADESGQVMLTATDLEIFYQGRLPATVDRPGAMMVPARSLDVMGTLRADTVEIDCSDEFMLGIRTADAEYSLFGQAPEDFPSLPGIDEIQSLRFSLATFKAMMGKVLYSVSIDETKRELCGVLLQGDGKVFRMVATDGRRLGLAEQDVTDGFERFDDVIVPAKVMKELQKFQDPDLVVEMKVCRTQVVFTLGDVTYTSRLIEGRYPAWENVIPKEKCCKIRVRTDLLGQHLRGIIPIAREISFTIKCRFEKDRLEITALSSKIGKGVRSVPIENDGEPIVISYNAKYLQECLNALESGHVIFEPTTTVKATRILPETDPAGERHINILMPVRTA